MKTSILLASFAIAFNAAAQEQRIYGTLSITNGDTNNDYGSLQLEAKATFVHPSGLFMHGGGGVRNWHESAYPSNDKETYGFGYHDEKYGRVSYQQDYEDASTPKTPNTSPTLCGSRNHRYTADYYAQRTTFSIAHYRSSVVGCGLHSTDDSTQYTAQWYPSDNLAVSGGITEGETTRSFYVNAQNRWQTDLGSMGLMGSFFVRPATAEHKRWDAWGAAISFRPGDHKSMLSAHRSVFDSAPIILVHYIKNGSQHWNIFSVSYTF